MEGALVGQVGRKCHRLFF